jgi:hypothetical protein
MAPDREVSNAELAEDIAGLRDDLKTFRAEVVIKDVYDAQREADAERVKHLAFRLGVLEERQTFVGRVAWTGVILPVLAGVLVAVLVALLVVVP